jgi:DNA-directed RNA polymerase, mitochondrial
MTHDLPRTAPVMRYKDSQEQLMYLKHASVLGNVELVYAGLDVLGSTPWKINRRVFDVVLQVWNSGERFAKIPPSAYDSPEPVKPPTYETDLKVRSAYLLRQKIYVQNRSNNHSERCNVNYKIEMARAVSFVFSPAKFMHSDHQSCNSRTVPGRRLLSTA